MEALLALRAAVKANGDTFETLDAHNGQPADLAGADILKINETGQEFDLSAKTAFESANPELGFIDLRTIVNCWNLRDLSVPQYIAASDKLGIPNLKFLERTDLIEWLEGASNESDYIKRDQKSSSAGAQHEEDVSMPDATWRAAKNVRGTLVNHASLLRGQKNIDFSNVAVLSHKKLVSEFRNAGKTPESFGRPSSDSAGRVSSGIAPLKPAKGKDPIILLSPSPSSLLNMANVKEFLENGVFSPVLKSSNSPNLLRINRNSKLIGPKVRFVVVDSVSQFKPEYWDRVVAVFVTGQSWQLRPYKWHDAHTLFQHVLGFGLVYKNDPLPELLKQWNVKIEPIDRSARFRDREVVERIWERIEAHMVSRGWPVANSS